MFSLMVRTVLTVELEGVWHPVESLWHLKRGGVACPDHMMRGNAEHEISAGVTRLCVRGELEGERRLKLPTAPGCDVQRVDVYREAVGEAESHPAGESSYTLRPDEALDLELLGSIRNVGYSSSRVSFAHMMLEKFPSRSVM